MTFVVAAFYHFFDFPDFAEKRSAILDVLKRENIKGSILIADEGINGTVSGTRESIDTLLAYLQNEIVHGAFEHKESFHETQPFKRAKVRLKKELISLGEPAFVRHPRFMRGSRAQNTDRACDSRSPDKPGMTVGNYIDPTDWNALIADPDTIVIDTRNSYEVHLGTFEKAIDPGIRSFKQLPAYTRKTLSDAKQKKIATFCTGGIRCEKYTAWLKAEGFENVYHLKGGILKYLEEIPPEESKWHGECYVFDERVAVGHGLVPSTTASVCKNCGHALTEGDKDDRLPIQGKSCKFCT